MVAITRLVYSTLIQIREATKQGDRIGISIRITEPSRRCFSYNCVAVERDQRDGAGGGLMAATASLKPH